jgi:cytidylate kinase
MENIGRIISDQVQSWATKEEKAMREKDLQAWPVITISREFGAGGRSLARALGKRIGFKVWDKELLTAIAEESGADERFLASLDERRRKLIDDALYSSFMGFKHSNTNYFRSLQRVVQTIGAHGKSIIVGRGGNYIIKSPETLRIRLVCPLEARVSYVAKKKDISENSARKLIQSRDSERADFIRHYFKRDSGASHDYDLVLNAETFNLSQLAELVFIAYEKKAGRAVALVK